jgi:hypothetical protein
MDASDTDRAIDEDRADYYAPADRVTRTGPFPQLGLAADSPLHAAPEEQLGRRCAAAFDKHSLPATLSKTIDR